MCNSRYGDFENSFIAIIHARALVYQMRRRLTIPYMHKLNESILISTNTAKDSYQNDVKIYIRFRYLHLLQKSPTLAAHKALVSSTPFVI